MSTEHAEQAEQAQGPDTENRPAGRTWQVRLGAKVFGSDGAKIGTLEEVHSTYLTVAKGFLFQTARHIPTSAVERADDDTVYLNLTGAQVADQSWEAIPDAEQTAPAARQPEPRDAVLAEAPPVPAPAPAPTATDERSAQPASAEATESPGELGPQQIDLREERLVPHVERRQAGEIGLRKEVEQFPGRLEVDARREEVEVEHVPVGQEVDERVSPWHEDDVLVVPVYEEQLVVTKRLVLREQIRIRRVEVSERKRFEEPLRRERLVIDDPDQTGAVQEVGRDAEDRTNPDA